MFNVDMNEEVTEQCLQLFYIIVVYIYSIIVLMINNKTEMSNTKVIEQIIKRAKDQNQKDIELLLRDIKTHNKVEEQRRAKKEEMRLRAEEREKRAIENRRLNEELQKEKVKQIKERQKSKEVKRITQEYHKLAERQTNFNGERVQEINERTRKQYESNVYSKLNQFSNNRQQYLDKIRERFYLQNEDVRNKMENYREEEKKENNDLKNEIDIANAKRYDNYKNITQLKEEENYERAERINEKHINARKRKNQMIQQRENQIYKIVNDIKNGNDMNTIIENEKKQREGIIPEHIKKNIEQRNEVKRKQSENSLILENQRKMNNEEILQKEFEKFKNANKVELDVKKKQQRNILRTVFAQEDYDRKVEDMEKKINQIKNNSVYRVDPSKLI